MNSSELIAKAKRIKLLILDVDGVLTSGHIYYGTQGFEMRGFHIHDGLGIKLLQKMHIDVGIISAKKSEAVMQRIQDLEIKHYYLGYEKKTLAFNDLKNKLKLRDEEIAYMGDDLPDLPILSRVAFAISVPNAPEFIKKHVHFVTRNQAGNGAVREVCELIMQAQDQQAYQSMLESYLFKNVDETSGA